MKFSYNWLKEFVDTTLSADQIGEVLTSVGLEVAGIEHRAVPEGIVVAKIATVEKHPNADRLSVCTVEAGQEPLQIVCGAPNVRPGMIVPLATLGTTLGPDFKVKKAKIRGVESFGMLCSERELGISDEHAGLMDLPQDLEIGSALSAHVPSDAVIEIELTPNRGDCLSLLGVAREVAAKTGASLRDTARRPEESGGSLDDHITVTIDNQAACPRYAGRMVRGVTIAESPEWMKQRLRAAGLRPINNVVDITNYILLQFGQPMHAFDYSRIRGKKIVVKNATNGQKFTTLDDVERQLTADDLLICDGEGPVALAGIMGGADSQIADTTTDVFLECAYFEPVTVRKTSKRLGLSSDSSYRFERGVDPEQGLIDALDTAAELLRDLAGGQVVSGRVDQYPKPVARRQVSLRPSQVKRLLGIDIDNETILGMMQSLQIKLVEEKDGAFSFEAPTYRHDLEIEVDLIEEVGRLYGYDNIPTNEWAAVSLKRAGTRIEDMTATIRMSLAGMGFHETATNSMTSESWREWLTPQIEPVTLRNPLNPEMAQMRTTLAGSLLQATAYNLNRRNSNNRFFEIGKTFAARTGEVLPEERTVVAILMEGALQAQTWHTDARPLDFYTLKGVIEALAARIRIPAVTFEPTGEAPVFYAPQRARVDWENHFSGFCGQVDEAVLSRFGIDNTTVLYAELDITDLLAADVLPEPSYKPLPRFPAVERDFSFVMKESLAAAVIANQIRQTSQLVERVEPFDVYQGEKLGAGRKSVTFSVRLRADDRTLTDKEADAVTETIIGTMKEKFDAVLRS